MIRQIEVLNLDLVCGVPYAAIPLASYISTQAMVPMIMLRKNKKTHGTQKCVEGFFSEGQRCVVVEDVVTSGNSLLWAVEQLRSKGLSVDHCVVLLCRDEKGRYHLENHGVELYSIFEMSDFYDS